MLLTGDHEAAARALAEALGLDEYRAALLPEDKVAAVEELRARYGALAMVGDGVNDAPALAAADVGIAMGVAGTDAALETADVALMADELPKIPYALRLSRATTRNIRANIAFSLALKGVFLVMAIAGSATLWMAVARRHGRVAHRDRERAAAAEGVVQAAGSRRARTPPTCWAISLRYAFRLVKKC